MCSLALISNIGLAAPGTTGGSGSVTFEGEILDAPCSLASDSADQTVDLGQISNHQLNMGGKSEAHPFTIKLENCSFGVTASPRKARDSIYVGPTSGNVSFTFSGGETISKIDGGIFGEKLFAVSGSASGIGLVITDPSGNLVKNGEPTNIYNVLEGDNSFVFNSYMQALSLKENSVIPGDFQSVINFTLTYS